jgi:hypothetical protein
LIHDGNPPDGVPMPCASLLPEPTEISIRLLSPVKAIFRVEWPEPLGSSATTVSGLPDALRSPALYG